MKQLIDCEQKHQSDVARKARARRTRRLSGLVLLNVFLFVFSVFLVQLAYLLTVKISDFLIKNNLLSK